MDNIKTQVEIKSVEADNQQKCKIDADIPAFESSYDIRFITWWNNQGEAPKVGERGTAEMKATARQPYFIKKGLLEEESLTALKSCISCIGKCFHLLQRDRRMEEVRAMCR